MRVRKEFINIRVLSVTPNGNISEPPRFYFETLSFLSENSTIFSGHRLAILETPMFLSETPIFSLAMATPSFSSKTPRFSTETPRFSSETLRNKRVPKKNFRSPVKILGLQWEYGILVIHVVVSNETIWVSKSTLNMKILPCKAGFQS